MQKIANKCSGCGCNDNHERLIFNLASFITEKGGNLKIRQRYVCSFPYLPVQVCLVFTLKCETLFVLGSQFKPNSSSQNRLVR